MLSFTGYVENRLPAEEYESHDGKGTQAIGIKMKKVFSAGQATDTK